MKLTDWLRKSGYSEAQFASILGVSQATVNRYLSGSRRPLWYVLDRIVEATNGDVTANDFLGVEVPEKRRRRA